MNKFLSIRNIVLTFISIIACSCSYIKDGYVYDKSIIESRNTFVYTVSIEKQVDGKRETNKIRVDYFTYQDAKKGDYLNFKN